jgi:starch-binding outer membrane protein, SusD/RagB family
LNNNRPADAAALVTETAVPTSFIYFNEHSDNSGRQENSIWNLNGSNRRYTVSDVEGVNGLNFRSAQDPRIAWIDRNANGFDNTVRLFEQLRYPDRSADVVVADGIEARLIEAEAALRANDVTTYLAKLNALRASLASLMSARYTAWSANVERAFGSVPTLPPLTDPGTQAARVDLLFRERAFWLYGTGHRLGDFRRLIRQYGRAVNTVYPTGTWHKGGSYGTDVAFSLPFREVNNPNYDPSACDTEQP